MKKLRMLLIDNLDMPLESAYKFPQVGVPLGIFSISAWVHQQFGDRVELLDNISLPLFLHEGKDPLEEASKMVLEKGYDIIGIRSLSAGKEYLETLTQGLAKITDCPPIMVGGPYASDSPQELLNNHQAVDFVVSNEGEAILSEFLEKWFYGEDSTWRHIPGLSYRMGGMPMVNPTAKLMDDLDVLPLPEYSAIDLSRFSNVENPMRIGNNATWAPIMTQRGCPYHCLYCHEGFGKISRERSPEKVLAEIEDLYYNHGVTHIAVMDDIFNVRRTRAKEIMRRIIKSGMKLQISFPNGLRGDTMDEELVDLMVEAGTICIHYAIESASPRIQAWMKKKLKMDKITRIIEHTAQYDIIFRGFYMVGFPGETEEELKLTIDHAISSGFTETYFSILCMWPGTKILDAAIQGGWVDQSAFTHSTAHDPQDNGFEYSVDLLMSERLRGYGHTHFDPNRVAKNFRVSEKLGIDIQKVMQKEATYAQMIADGHKGSGPNPFVPDQDIFKQFIEVANNPDLAARNYQNISEQILTVPA